VDARRIAAQTNSQLESGDLTLLSYVPIALYELCQHWLDNHEHVLRSSVQMIARYRTATDRLLNYLKVHPVRQASAFTSRHAEGFTQYLREIEVAPNGHTNSGKRRLLDKGVKNILECCRALFSYAAQHRHLSPYAKNPFDALSVDDLLCLDASGRIAAGTDFKNAERSSDQ
jgi:integrase